MSLSDDALANVSGRPEGQEPWIKRVVKDLFGPIPKADPLPSMIFYPVPYPKRAAWMEQEIDAGLIRAMAEAGNQEGIQEAQALLLLELVQWMRRRG
jgi:hypothetical protein